MSEADRDGFEYENAITAATAVLALFPAVPVVTGEQAWDEGWFDRASYDQTPDVDEPTPHNPHRAANLTVTDEGVE